jgi:hypothetical protein
VKADGKQSRLYAPPKVQLTVNGLRGVISQKIALFITTAVRTSEPTQRYIPEDSTLHNHRCEDLRAYKVNYLLIYDYLIGV